MTYNENMKKTKLKGKYYDSRECLEEDLKDPEFEKIWDDRMVEFSIITAIIKKRAQNGISQKQLAHRMGTDQATLSRLEMGMGNPTIKYLNRLAKALGGELKVTIV